MASSKLIHAGLLVVSCLAMLSACATHPPHSSAHGVYRVTWTATRTSDHAALVSASTTVAVGGFATVRTDSIHPAEDKPAFPRFSVRLTARNTSGVLQVVSRASLLETARNKKGKLKVTKRNIGALLPMHPGETRPTNLPGDPVGLEVRLDRE